MAETFYRFHWEDCPAFTADNAWSGLWGAERSPDGSQTRCGCEGHPADLVDCPCTRRDRYTPYGLDDDQPDMPDPDCDTCDGAGIYTTCELCGGTGWLDCVRGYSCEYTAEALIRYITGHTAGHPRDDDGQVIVFTGHQAGAGFDGEPTVVPTDVLRSLPWSEFAAEHAGVNA